MELRTQPPRTRRAAGVARRARYRPVTADVPAQSPAADGNQHLRHRGGKSGISVDVPANARALWRAAGRPVFTRTRRGRGASGRGAGSEDPRAAFRTGATSRADLSDFATAMKGFRIPPPRIAAGQVPRLRQQQADPARPALRNARELRSRTSQRATRSSTSVRGRGEPGPGKQGRVPAHRTHPGRRSVLDDRNPRNDLQGRVWSNPGFEINGPDGTPGVKGSLDGFLKSSSDDPKSRPRSGPSLFRPRSSTTPGGPTVAAGPHS